VPGVGQDLAASMTRGASAMRNRRPSRLRAAIAAFSDVLTQWERPQTSEKARLFRRC
jgi:hypothetical protein